MLKMERHIDIDRFDYDLPDERIAKYPLEERSASKLLVYFVGDADRRQGTEHHVAHKTAAECGKPSAQHDGEDVVALANGGKSAR
mgnify:CR=1 FL=1